MRSSFLEIIAFVDNQGRQFERTPSQVIFGMYFAILTLAIQGLQRLYPTAGEFVPRQALFLLMMIGMCLDLVLVNALETVVQVDASYGPVVLWDVATFFIWLRAVDVTQPDAGAKFQSSWTVMVAPLMKIGRELLFVPYTRQPGLAYVDLLFGDVIVSLWIFVPLICHLQKGRMRSDATAERRFVLLIFVGCVYWFVSAFENVIGLAWGPFYPTIYQMLKVHGIPIAAINGLHVLIAITATVIVRRWDILGIGTRFGITSHKRKWSQASMGG